MIPTFDSVQVGDALPLLQLAKVPIGSARPRSLARHWSSCPDLSFFLYPRQGHIQMAQKLDDKVALVSGSGRGIGRSIALKLDCVSGQTLMCTGGLTGV
jgi:hypothetical protein